MFRLPVRVAIESGARRRIPALLQERNAQRVLLVSDAGLQATPWVDELFELISGTTTCDVFSDVEPNPRNATIDALAEQARTDGVDMVVGLGGGSVLDAAKAVAMLLRNEGPIMSFEGKNRFANGSAPYIALPTTCGTGSEVTWVSVVSVPESGKKISIKGDAMFPMAALVDADLIKTLPDHLVASTAMDALTHAIEAVVGKPANPVSDALAIRAIEMILTALRPAVGTGPERKPTRAALMEASTLAGIAFGNADVGAVHCLSESIGGMFDHPHGLLNALLLVPVLCYEREVVAGRLAHIERSLAGLQPVQPSFQNRPADATSPKSTEIGLAAQRLLDRISSLAADLDLPPFTEFGIPRNAFSDLGALAEANGSNASNRMPLVAGDYVQILESAAGSSAG